MYVPDFNATKHQYSVNGRPLPSVSRIIRTLGTDDFSHVQEIHLTLGKYRHQATEFDDRGTLDYAALDPSLRPYVDAWRKFKRDAQVVVLHAELALYHPELWYAGTIDRVARILNHPVPVVIDIKTGGRYEATRYQLAAYRELLKASGIYTRTAFEVLLRRDGLYQLSEATDHDYYFGRFRFALAGMERAE